MKMNGKPPIAPLVEMPVSGIQAYITLQNGVLTIEFGRSISWLQLNKQDATAFVNGLAAYIKAMN